MNSCGIYYIYCVENEKFYIGQSVDIEKRLKAHFRMLKRNNHHNKYLQNAYNKYGYESFVFGVAEYCNIEKLDELEIYYIEKYNTLNPSGLNGTLGGATCRGMKHSEETKKSWSDKRKGKFIGKDHARSIPVISINMQTGEELKFESICLAGAFIGKKGCQSNIRSCTLGKRNHAYGYYWKLQ